MRRRLPVLAAALLLAATSAAAEEHVVLKLGHTLSTESHYQLTALEFARQVAKATGGKVEVQVFAQSQLGGEVQMTQALRTGTQEMMIGAQAVVANTIKEWQILDLPYLFNSIAQANQVLQAPVGRRLLDLMERHNLVGLAWLSALERDVMTTRKPVATLADLAGLKVRVMQSPGYVSAYRALGANPTPMAYSQLYLALQQGLVDGADTSPDQALQDKFNEVAHQLHLTHVHYLPIVLAIGRPAWDRLSSGQQAALRAAAAQAVRFDIAEYRRQYDAALAALPGKGVQVRNPELRAWEKAAEAARTELIDKIPDGRALYQAIQAARSGRP